ncbi:riboflavin biosynthesis protein RibD [Streptomyces armeniacus]|uniref:Riboflavin biosynthesis protein RibD n=1 Tax=Streptomyces armeniacus TaxID=83291 RepID=A0A345XSM6_9ACTN|nr:dihydrofolate reductase family protein [Streptomyces armeniacus]AXK34642.1 riboflavin biosynthesis protein RibD [Streptomyces armeniacus]
MRRVVLAMMTTLNGRLDDPDAWVTGVSDDHYQEIDRGYATFDTILVGRVTAEEMYAYWPTAGDEEGAGEPQKAMAEKMHSYKKYVFTTDPDLTLEWHNAEPVAVSGDDEIRAFVEDLKARPGRDIHLSGGARLAQTLVRLGLVDEFRFFVFPVYSPGASWFDRLEGQQGMELISSTSFESGAVAVYCRPTPRPAA